MCKLEDSDPIRFVWEKIHSERDKWFMPVIILKEILFRMIPTVHVCYIYAMFAAAGCFFSRKPSWREAKQSIKTHGERPYWKKKICMNRRYTRGEENGFGISDRPRFRMDWRN